MASPTITFRVPEETGQALASLSEATGRPVGDLVRQGIMLLLADLDEDDLVQQLEQSRQQRDEALREALRAAAASSHRKRRKKSDPL